MMRFLAPAIAFMAAIVVAAGQAPAPASVDAAFATFFQASSTQEAAGAVAAVVKSGVSFDEAVRRLRAGRSYSNDVARGVVQAGYTGGSGQYYYTLDVPETYDPARKYQVRIQLHGGVGRVDSNVPPRPGSNARLAGAEQIYVMPYAWKDAPWWSVRQTENLRAILDRVKRAYNVDENRVALSGVSDGGTGAYFTAMRDTTPYASVLPLNGFFMVLRNELLESEGDVFPNNLVNTHMFIVNGGRDPQYPTSAVDPYVDQLKKGGVDLVYRPQPNAAHDTSWWPDLKGEFETFVADHPRRPLPDRLTWEAGAATLPARAHWLVIDRLAAPDPAAAPLPDLNRMSKRPELDFGIRGVGTHINHVVKGSNAQQIGLQGGDTIVTLNNQPVAAGVDIADALRSYPAGRPLILNVRRGTESIRLTGRYAPSVLANEAETMLPPQEPSGRVDLVRDGNTVRATTRGVAAFTLLISPDQFDLNRAVTVVVNDRVVFDAVVPKNLETLLKWAARDNDRTMLFAAEVAIDVAR